MNIHLSTTRLSRVVTEFNDRVGTDTGSAQVKLVRIGTILMLRIEGALLDAHAGAVLERIQPLGAYDKVLRFVFDLKACTALGPQVVGFLSGFMLQMRVKGGRTVLIGPRPDLLAQFEVLQLDLGYDVRDSLDDAG